MKGTAPMALDARNRVALHVLGHLYFRMGFMDRARRVYAALVESALSFDRQAHMGLAATALEQGDGPVALEQLRLAMGKGALPSRLAVLHLMRAKALNLCGRQAEARSAAEMYIHLAGENKRS